MSLGNVFFFKKRISKKTLLFAVVGLGPPSTSLSDGTAVMATSLTSLLVFLLSVQQVKAMLASIWGGDGAKTNDGKNVVFCNYSCSVLCLIWNFGTSDLSLLLDAIYSPYYCRIFKENHTLLCYKNPSTKICETRILEYILFMKSILKKGKI